jgi:hypothetical protein
VRHSVQDLAVATNTGQVLNRQSMTFEQKIKGLLKHAKMSGCLNDSNLDSQVTQKEREFVLKIRKK